MIYHPCVVRPDDLRKLLEANPVVGEVLPYETYRHLDRGMSYVRSVEGHDYWYSLNPRTWGDVVRPWTEEDRKKIEVYLGGAVTLASEDIWI